MPTEQPGKDAPSPEQSSSESGRVWPAQDHSWTLQQLHHLTNDVGALKEAVNTLKSSVSEQSKTLNWIKYVMFVAIGALLVIGYLIDKRFDKIIEALGAK